MKTSEELKEIVKEKYGEIADKAQPASSCCCGCEPTDKDYTVFSDDYTKLKGYVADADLSLGCGLPTEYAKIKEGDTVVDLGAGAGNDCFVARAFTGEKGQVIGIDFTDSMVSKAKSNALKLGLTNVKFLKGDIENIPLPENTADVVVSNCVMNLVPSKQKAFEETYRITKPGGHFSISDIVLKGELPDALREEAALYAGCVTGAIEMDDYLSIIKNVGFKNITIQKQTLSDLPEEVYLKYMTGDEWKTYKSAGSGIYSISVYGEK